MYTYYSIIHKGIQLFVVLSIYKYFISKMELLLSRDRKTGVFYSFSILQPRIEYLHLKRSKQRVDKTKKLRKTLKLHSIYTHLYTLRLMYVHVSKKLQMQKFQITQWNVQ